MKKVIQFFTAVFLSASATAQVINTSYTDPNNNLSIDLFHLAPTVDGGYLLCGDVWSGGTNQNNRDVLVIKTGSNGAIQWSKSYGTSNRDDVANRVVAVQDGYILGGFSSSFNGLPAILLMKIDLSGKPVWTKGYKLDNNEQLYDMILTTDGNLALSGYYQHDVPRGSLYSYAFIAKANLSGEMQWLTPSCMESTLPIGSLVEDADGGLVTPLRFYEGLWKVSATGRHRWYGAGGPQFRERNVIKVEKRIEGGFALYGSSYGTDQKFHMMIEKFDTSGRLINAKILTTPYDNANSIDYLAVQKPDLGYQISIVRNNNNILFNTDSSGKVTSQFLTNLALSPFSSKILKKSGSYLLPSFNSLYEIDFSGSSINKTPASELVSLSTNPGTITSSINKSYRNCTARITNLTTTLTEKTLTLNGTTVGLLFENLAPDDKYLYPNPSAGVVSLKSGRNEIIDISIINSKGNVVATFVNVSSKQEIKLDHLPDGVYYYKASNSPTCQKLIIKK